MKKIVFVTLVFILSVIFLQNCGETSAKQFGYTSSSMYNLYPYHKEAPSYFADVQVVDKQKINASTTTYRLIATAVSTADENSNIDVEILVMDSSETLLCPRIITSANRGNNHIEVDNCISTDDVNSIIVKVLAGPEGGELEEARSQSFDLQHL